MGEPTGQPRGKWALLILGIGLILLGVNLRIGVASIGPVLGEIRVSLSLSATSASLLTMAVLAVGILLRLRLHPSLLALFAGTVLVGAAIASGLTAPLLTAMGGSWRPALAVWALPALLALVVWIPQLRCRLHTRRGTTR